MISFQSFGQTVPYNWKNAPIGGGGFVTGIVTHKTSGDRYCRTDVGGAYRWDATNNKWVQLLDWLGDSQGDLYGVEALALDPQNANNVYMLCGTNYNGNGKSAIIKSTDKGNTFTVIDLTSKFKVHGNGDGRGNGERLAVDPKNSNILYCGTRANGLWKSTDAGLTWSQAWSGVTTTTNGNGICFVLFDPSSSVVNGATQTIYIGVSRTGAGNVYRSTDGGATFTDITATTAFMPHRVALQGTTMYVTYSDTAGPQASTGDGKLYKLNTATGMWTNVTPTSWKDHAYGGVSIDPTNVNRVIVSSCGVYTNKQFGIGWGDYIFLTTDGGSTWTLKNGENATYDANGMAWSSGGAINWMDCIEFDQASLNKVRVIGGGGVYTCSDITAANCSWKYDVVGIEETAFLDGISIPGGSLISSFGDVTGFVHEPLTSYPSKKLSPTDGNNQSIAYAGANANRVVRASNGGNVVYYSNDKGATWTGCATNMGSDGKIAISADGGTILHCPGSSTTTYYTTNNGASWSACSGVSVQYAAPVADQVNSNYFYIFDPRAGQIYRSTNKGVSFSVAGTPGASTANYPWEPAQIRTVPGFEGHVWVPLFLNGLKYSTNAGVSYTTVSNVTYCKAIGIGKTISGASYPSVFIWGTVSGVTGLFRSTDQGATWLRINNNSTQFAGAPLLVGDMNVDGRVFMSAGGGRGLIYWEPAACTPTAITPYVQVNGTWSQTSSATVASGATVILGPQPVTGGSWSWSGMASGTTREVTLTPTSSGTATATYTNASGCQSTQVFTITVSGGSTFVTIANRATGLLIDGMGRTSAGSTCGQYANSGSWNQMWTLETSGSYVYIKNRNTGLYIDGRGVSTNGAYAGQWSSSTSNNLQWQQETTGGYVKFKNRATGLYLDGMGNTTNGADLGQWSSSTSNNQQWTVTTTTARMATQTEDVEANEFQAFPNPFNSSINVIIQEPLKVKSLELYDLMGRQVEIIEGSHVATKQTMGSLLGSGIYILKVNRIGKSHSMKVIKN
ncbi:MAG TPA: RICIN domain-containing protein [Cyclobacteriaceae bacterium]